MNKIARCDFPALDSLLWDSKLEWIEPVRAFQVYEKRWRYIDQNKLSSKEKQLIAHLTRDVGHGCFMPA